MVRQTSEAILRGDQLLVADFDRAFAELPGTGEIQRRWTWATFGDGPHAAFATFLTFTISRAGERVTVATGPVDEETRLYVTASDVAEHELGEFYGPQSSRLAERCAAGVAEWLSARVSRPAVTPAAPEAALDPVLPFALWPEPLPSLAQPGMESVQLRLLRS